MKIISVLRQYFRLDAVALSLYGFSNSVNISIETNSICSANTYKCDKLKKPVVRYSEKHIGLETKRFLDQLGSC